MPMPKGCLNYIRRYDEYYTKYEHVKNIFERFMPLDEIRDKIIYCPCDSDKSNFVIYLKEHKDDIGYKELIYTSDDYNTHLDLFEKCDVVITNPPFSKLIKEFIPILNKIGKKFFIFGSLISLNYYAVKFGPEVKFVRTVGSDFFTFDTPSDLPNCPVFIYISNMNIPCYYEGLPFKEDGKFTTYAVDDDGRRYKVYDKMINIPPSEHDIIYCPSTVFLEHYRKYFDIVDTARHKQQYEDGKSRYTRFKVRRKENVT